MSRDKDRRAAEYALGTLGPAERRRVEAEMASDTELCAHVEQWERRLIGLEDGREEAPPPEVWERIERALDAAPSRTVRNGDGTWVSGSPGVERKLLHTDPATGAESCLVRCAPGAVLDPHDHPIAEECLVLEGELIIGHVRLVAGDYQVAAPGSRHPAMTSPAGCLLFVRGRMAA
jgi:quercetin dioxygenase-like cupin family protein